MADNYTLASFGIEVPSGCQDRVRIVMTLLDIIHSCWDYDEINKVRDLTKQYNGKASPRARKQFAIELDAAAKTCVTTILTESFMNVKKQDPRFEYAQNILPALIREIAVLHEEILEHQGFDWSFNPEEDDEIWIRGDESIDIDSAIAHVRLIARLVPEMQVTAPWYATWANTCSAQRIDEFGGGAVVFDVKRASWMDASGWKNKEMKRFLAAAAKSKQRKKSKN
jgi:hypothetical protein